MYVNFKMLEVKELDFTDLLTLQAAKQNKAGRTASVIEKVSDARLEALLNRGLLSTIKGKKSESIYTKYRITKKGSSLLDLIETPEVEEEDLILFDWISDVYLKKGKEIGNKRKTKMYIALFRTHSGIEKNHLATLLEKFVNDDSNMEYNFRLEYAFFKPSNMFQVRFDLEQSRLYQYYINHKTFFDNLFENLN